MGWTFQPPDSAFRKHRNLWDALNQNRENHFVLDFTFVGELVQHFATPDTWIGMSQAKAWPGLGLINRSRAGFGKP